MSSDNREQERFSLSLQAKVSYRHTNDQSPVIISEAANISVGGAFVTTEHKFPISSKVTVEFHLSLEDLRKLKFILSMDSLKQVTGDKIWVRASGVVIRQEEKGVAVIFDTDYQLTPMQTSATSD